MYSAPWCEGGCLMTPAEADTHVTGREGVRARTRVMRVSEQAERLGLALVHGKTDPPSPCHAGGDKCDEQLAELAPARSGPASGERCMDVWMYWRDV